MPDFQNDHRPVIDGDGLQRILAQIEAAELEVLGWDIEDLERDEAAERDKAAERGIADDGELSRVDPDRARRRLCSTRKRVRDAAIAELYPNLVGVDLAPGLPLKIIEAAAAIAMDVRRGSSPHELGFYRFLGGGGRTASHAAKLGLGYRILALVTENKEIKITSVIPREAYQGAKLVR